MKTPMVLTSHDQLGNTGLPDRFLAGGVRGPYFVLGMLSEPTLASPKGVPPPIRKAICPKIRRWQQARFKKRRGGAEGSRQHGQTRGHEGGRLRHRFLSGRHGPDVGSCGELGRRSPAGGFTPWKMGRIAWCAICLGPATLPIRRSAGERKNTSRVSRTARKRR